MNSTLYRIIRALLVSIPLRVWRRLLSFLDLVIEFLLVLPFLSFICFLIGYFGRKKIDIGLGPEPLINNVYHKRALQKKGFSVETFVDQVYFITDDFDYRGDKIIEGKGRLLSYLWQYYFFIRSVARYRCIYIYFNGGPLYGNERLKKYEPYLIKLAKTKVVVMPYGGDVGIMKDCPNLLYKHALDADYPTFHRRIKEVTAQLRRWTIHADHVLSGCDWVDYTYHWDTLTLAHFSIDVDDFNVFRQDEIVDTINFTNDRPLRILHAPNHRSTKGTKFFVNAINELKQEGYPVELILIQGKPNEEVLREMAKADIVADQLIIGWYAMFSLEAMSMGKPVMCYLRQDLIDLYLSAGVLESENEIPHLNTYFKDVKNEILKIFNKQVSLSNHSKKGLQFVQKYHSTDAIGEIFSNINKSLGIKPTSNLPTPDDGFCVEG